MVNIFIISTPHVQLRPLAWQGIQVQSAFNQLSHTLESRLGERQAAIFAEPISDSSQEAIDWYAKKTGTPIKLAELPVSEQNQVRAELQDFASNVSALVASLKQSNDSNSLLAGALLELALSYPSDEYLYALRDEQGNLAPLMVGWGFALAGLSSAPDSITGLKLMPIITIPDQVGAEYVVEQVVEQPNIQPE